MISNVFLSVFNSDILCLTTHAKEVTVKSPPESIQSKHFEDNSEVSPPRTTEEVPPRTAKEVQIAARELNKKRQMQQADRMKKRHKKAMKDRGVGEGAVVTIKNDYRDISHPLGTVGVVIEAKESGGVRVCTEWGVIVQGGTSRKEYWIPRDRYVVNAKKDGPAVLSDVLEEIRKNIISGEFNEEDQHKITLQESHRALTNESPKKTRKCRCKNGNCKPGCGCWGKCVCHSGCSCNRNCANPMKE